MTARWSHVLVAVHGDDAAFERFGSGLAELARRSGCRAVEMHFVPDTAVEREPIAALPEAPEVSQ